MIYQEGGHEAATAIQPAVSPTTEFYLIRDEYGAISTLTAKIAVTSANIDEVR